MYFLFPCGLFLWVKVGKIEVMKLYNSLSDKKERFEPIDSPVGVYSCGPTVYDYVHIGNWRTYTLGDLVVRGLEYLDYEVFYVMNITDVGHLTGDNLGDASQGEDRVEKASRREGKKAEEIVQFYTRDFKEGVRKMNLRKPDKLPKASEHIREQIELVERIEEKGFTYKISDGIYFDTQAWEEAGNEYGQLSSLDEIREGARVEINEEKKDGRDFALWKFSPKDEKRQMEWDSPWGKGFPGWHIECSAMSMKYLGEQFDIHIGGEDLKSTHHPNEIAQSEAATGKKPFVRYWLHGAFLQIEGGRMGKSLGNAYSLHDLEEKGFSALDLRYFYFTGHWRKPLNFTWEALKSAQQARGKLQRRVREWQERVDKGEGSGKYEERFKAAVEDDLNMPEALAVVWELVGDKESEENKLASILKFDQILGLRLGEEREIKIPEKVRELVRKREWLREQRKWEEADKVREEIEKQGFKLEDKGEKTQIIIDN